MPGPVAANHHQVIYAHSPAPGLEPSLSTMTRQTQKTIDWPALLTGLRGELAALDDVARLWLARQVDEIAALQAELDDLSRSAGGPAICAACDDNCCGCGRHHLTLTNLLAYLLDGEEPPAPDFNCTCPFLGDTGCRLPVARRPYNCITFFCEALEERLDREERELLCCLDRQLRRVYQRIAERFPAATLRGFWIALERAGGGHLLSSPEQGMLE